MVFLQIISSLGLTGDRRVPYALELCPTDDSPMMPQSPRVVAFWLVIARSL